jgi:hypothetical protein
VPWLFVGYDPVIATKEQIMSKFARTMDQAFPKGAEYGCAVKIYKSNHWLDAVVAAVIGVGLACLLVAWWSS